MKLITKDNKYFDLDVTKEDVLEILSYSDDYIEKMILEDRSNFRYGLSFNEFLYFVFCIDSPKSLGKYYPEFNRMYEKFGNKLDYIELISLLKEEGKYYPSLDFEISKELMEALNKNMNPNYTKEEQIIYYYLKSCFLLQIDTKYNFVYIVGGEYGEYNFKKSINNLSNIDLGNNEVACFEHTAIIDKLIEENGGVITNREYKGDHTHVNSKSVTNRIFYQLDALEDPYGVRRDFRDMLDVKLNRGYHGIVMGVDDFLKSKNTKSELINRIYRDVQEEFKDFLRQAKFEDEVMNELFNNIDLLNLNNTTKQIVKNYFIKFNSLPLSGIEYYMETIFSYRLEIQNNFRGFMDLTGVGSIIDDYDFKLVLSVKDLSNNYIYFLFGGENIDILNKEEMIRLIDENQIITIPRNKQTIETRTIPGINVDFQNEKSQFARSKLIPKIIVDIYQKSKDGKLHSKTKIKKIIQ